MKKPLNFVLIGRSGCGKGTQAKLLIKHFGNLFYVSSGGLFRNLIKADSAVALRVKKTVGEGKLPFDDLAITLWMYEIVYNVKEEQGFILDGAPRRLTEAKALNDLLKFLEREKRTFILLINVSRNEAFQRLSKRRICKKCGRMIPWVGDFKKLKVCDKCGGELGSRHDDTVNAINSRLDFYDERVVKVIDYCKKQNRFVDINGDQSIQDVFKEILKKVHSF